MLPARQGASVTTLHGGAADALMRINDADQLDVRRL
jgi:hypothetical protein